MRSLSLNGSPLSCRVLRLADTVRHSLRALHSLNVMSLERIAGILLLKLDFKYLFSVIGCDMMNVCIQNCQFVKILNSILSAPPPIYLTCISRTSLICATYCNTVQVLVDTDRVEYWWPVCEFSPVPIKVQNPFVKVYSNSSERN